MADRAWMYSDWQYFQIPLTYGLKKPTDWEQRELDGQILYESSGGIPQGRLAIAG